MPATWPDESPDEDDFASRVLPERLLVIMFLVTVVIASTSMALTGPQPYYLIEAAGIAIRVAAVGWLLATRGRRRHPWTLATLLLVDILLLTAVFAVIPFVRDGLLLNALIRLPLASAALPRRQTILVLGALLGGPGAVLGWEITRTGVHAVAIPVLWIVTVTLTAFFIRNLAQHLAAARARALQLAERQRHEALHDALTGLPNRLRYADRLAEAVAVAGRTGADVAVLLIDLDRFKLVNDCHGHQLGDQVLVAVSRRLQHAVRTGDTLARLGGDEFAVILPDVREPGDAMSAAVHLRDALRSPAPRHGDAPPPAGTGEAMYVTASIGIAFARDRRHDLGSVLREADIAMYRAKARGPGSVEVFDETMGRATHRRLDLETQLRHDLEAGSDALSVAFQPIVDPATGRILGAEALARWTCPRYGAIPPDEFIAIAEESDLIHDLGHRVLRTALEHTTWWCALHPGFEISVNLSPVQLHRPELADDVCRLIKQAGVPAGQVCLEITEGVLLDSYGASEANLRALNDAGITLAVDDFGSGYSSLAQLRRFPVHKLKADRSFVDDVPLLRAVADLAGALDAHALAEGVETAEQRERIVELGYTQAQGYLFFRPQPPAAITDHLHAQNADRTDSSDLPA